MGAAIALIHWNDMRSKLEDDLKALRKSMNEVTKGGKEKNGTN